MPGRPRTTHEVPIVWQRLQVSPQVGRHCPRRPRPDPVYARQGLLRSDEQNRLCTPEVVLGLTTDVTNLLTVTGVRLTARPTPHSDGDDAEQQSRGRKRGPWTPAPGRRHACQFATVASVNPRPEPPPIRTKETSCSKNESANPGVQARLRRNSLNALQAADRRPLPQPHVPAASMRTSTYIKRSDIRTRSANRGRHATVRSCPSGSPAAPSVVSVFTPAPRR